MKSLFFLVCVLFVYTCAETTINFNFDGMIPPLPSCNCNATVYCGDGVCNGDETNITCPNDCTVNVPVCGDRSCDTNETAFSCPIDCSRCGDSLCDNTESLTSCPTDCVACGDGFCTTGLETVSSCPTDCANICGNNVCESGESFTICPVDCPCVRQCTGRNCGSDGCGGSCGTCSSGQACNANGVCVCSPNCVGRNCGNDGCGGSCGTCFSPQTCNANGVCVDPVCTPSCAGRNCGNDGCGGSCGTCPTGQICNSAGTCELPTGVRTVEFTLYQVNSGSAGFASGVTISSSLGSAVTTGTGFASLQIAINDTVTFSGAGYQTVTVVIYGSSTDISFVIPPTLSANEVFIALLWEDTTADLDLHMFGPGDLVYYSNPEGVVNWEYSDKNLSYPFAQWKDYSGIIGLEATRIYQLNFSAIYEFTAYIWSLVDGGDASYNWDNVGANMLVFGGSATGLSTGLFFEADAPVPPAGFTYGFWSPFSFRPDGTGNLDIIEDLTPYDPPISLASIDAGEQQFISCSYAYCPYRLP